MVVGMKLIFKILVTSLLLLVYVENVSSQEKIENRNQFAKEVFKTKYEKREYDRFSGNIVLVGERTIQYDEKILEIIDTHDDYMAIFLNGILYPNIMTGNRVAIPKVQSEIDSMTTEQRVLYNLVKIDSIKIGHFRELNPLNSDPKIKRFVFWEYRKNFMNPTEYYIELQNKNATIQTSIQEFIENAVLTFYYRGTLIL